MFPAYCLEQAAEQTVYLLEIRHDTHVTFIDTSQFAQI